MPLSSEPVTSLSNKSSSLQSFKPEKNSMPLQLELVTSLSNKSPSIQPFLLTSLEEHDPFQIFLTRTSSMKWGIVAVPSHWSHAQHAIQSLRSRCFVTSHFKTCGRVFSNQRRIYGDNEDLTSYWKTYSHKRRKASHWIWLGVWLVLSLRSRCFVMSHFKTRGRVFSNQRRIDGDPEW